MKRKIISLMLVFAFVFAIIPTSALAAEVYIESANVYYDEVSGYATPGAKVELYKNSKRVGSTTASSSGSYEISNNFGYYDGKYDYRYWDYYYEVNPRDYSRFSDYEEVMSRRYPELSYSEIRNLYDYRYDYRYWDWYYYDDYKYYPRDYYYYYRYYDDISDYHLVATKNGISSKKYYLSSSDLIDYYYRDRYYYPKTRIVYDNSFVIIEANGGYSIVRGKGAIPYGEVIVRDGNNVELGRSDISSDGKFVIATNRPLKSGEIIRAISTHEGYADKVTSFAASVTATITSPEFNYKNVFTIGSKEFVQTINGDSNKKVMDVAPYLASGRTMLPLRYVAESLGYKVTWNEETQNAVFVSGADTATINLYSRTFYVNGERYTLSVDPVTVNGRLMLPVSDIGRALGLSQGRIGEGKNIEWDEINQVVVIQVNQ